MTSLEHVNFSYGDREVFRNLSLDFARGEVTAVTGPSGIGKTTLLRLLTGLEKPDSGKVIADQPVAVMFQEARLLPWFSVKKNLTALLGKDREELVGKWLAAVGLEQEADSLPEALSGGMRQRLSLARTLAYAEYVSAGTVILDEPFSALDPVLHGKMRELTFRVLKGRTVILITHDPADAEAADCIFQMNGIND